MGNNILTVGPIIFILAYSFRVLFKIGMFDFLLASLVVELAIDPGTKPYSCKVGVCAKSSQEPRLLDPTY